MEFSLTYRGPLPASQDNDKRSDIKQRIRLELSSQIAQLWGWAPLATSLIEGLGKGHLANGVVQVSFEDAHFKNHFEVETCGFKAIPIITRHNGLVCHLDIAVLRRERPGNIIHGGDIDNRIKTLFDALRMPLSDSEIPGNMRGNGEHLFCLLEDDSLITRVSVASDQLLRPLANGEEVHDVELLIRVNVKTLYATDKNRLLG